jgi:hypothetical protein
MTGPIPTGQQFDEYIHIASGHKCSSLETLASSTNPSQGDLTKFFAVWLKIYEEQQSALLSTYASNWLDSQPNFVRAVRALSTGRGAISTAQLSSAEIISAKVNRALEQYQVPGDQLLSKMENSAPFRRARDSWTPDHWAGWRERYKSLESREGRFRRYVTSFGNMAYWDLQKDIARALRRYYSRAIDQDLIIHNQVSAALGAISELRIILNDSILPKVNAILDADNWSELSRLQRYVDKLENRLESKRKDIIPNVRRDETLRERALLWDLRCAFRKQFKSDKPTALFYMLGLPGIEHPLDQRRVERIVKGWAVKL